MISVNRRSIAVCMSSSLARILNLFDSSSRLMRLSPRSIAISFERVRMPAAARPRACAMLPAMSYGYSSKSISSEDENRSSSGIRLSLNRPPQSLPSFLAMA